MAHLSTYYSNIRFVGGGYNPKSEHNCIDNRFASFYSIQLDMSNRIYYGINGAKPVILETPVIYLLHPDNSYQYGPTEPGDWGHGWLAFRGKRARDIFVNGFQQLAPKGYIYPARAKEFLILFKKVTSELNNPDQNHRTTLYLEEMLVHLIDGCQYEKREDPLLEKFHQLAAQIREFPFRNWSNSMCASKVFLSESHFRKRFKEIIGQSPHDYILYSRMKMVADTLITKRMSVKECAANYGYSDLAVFSRLFKNQIGLSPRQYIEAMLKI